MAGEQGAKYALNFFSVVIGNILDSLGLRGTSIGLIRQNLESKGVRGKIFKDKELAALEGRQKMAAALLSVVPLERLHTHHDSVRVFNSMSKGRSSQS